MATTRRSCCALCATSSCSYHGADLKPVGGLFGALLMLEPEYRKLPGEFGIRHMHNVFSKSSHQEPMTVHTRNEAGMVRNPTGLGAAIEGRIPRRRRCQKVKVRKNLSAS
jgi:hypothetical protein